MLQQFEEGEQLRGGESAHESHHSNEAGGHAPVPAPRGSAPKRLPHHHRAQEQPGEQDDLRRSGHHLHSTGQSGDGEMAAPTFTPCPFDQPHHPRHPAERGDVVRPEQAVDRQSVEGEGQAGDARAETAAGPALREHEHAGSAQHKMREREKIQRPRQRQQQVDERRRIECERVPLREEGEAIAIERIPQRQLAAPETFAMIMRQRIAEVAEVPQEERAPAQRHRAEVHQHQRRQQQRETPRTQPGIWRACGGVRVTVK